MIIGISGRIGSGKDTLAQVIREFDPSWEVKKFAAKLKQVASLLTGIPVHKFEDQEFKKQYMPPEWGMTYREFLQKLGTDAMRDGLHKNVWVNALMADYKQRTYEPARVNSAYKDYPNWLITDVRFPNEAEAVRSRGGIVIRITRGTELPAEALHTSETALDDYPFDHTISNNGTIDALARNANLLLHSL